MVEEFRSVKTVMGWLSACQVAIGLCPDSMVEESLLVNHDRSLMDTNFCYDTKQVATVASVHNMLEKLLLKLKLESKSSVTLHSLFESDRKEDSHHK